MRGVRVVRTVVAPFANRGFARRLLDQASFAGSATALAHRIGGADAVVVESPPLFLAAAGVAYARRLRAPLVINVADLWPDSAVELGALRNRRAVDAARALERFAYRHAAAVTAPTDGIFTALSMRRHIPQRVVRISPFVDTREFEMAPVKRRHGPLRVLYAGTVGLAHGLETLVEAARLVGPQVVHVTVAGGGAELGSVRDMAAAQADNVDVLGIIPADRVPQLYEQSDAAVVLLKDRPVFRGALPTKLFEAMAAGRPLVVSARGEAAELVERYGCGVAVPPEDPVALAAALKRMAGDEHQLRAMGRAGGRAAEAHDVSAGVDTWHALLERVVLSVGR